MCLHGDSNALGRRMPWAHTQNLQSFSIGLGCCADWHHPRGEYARASQICFLVPLPPTPELSSLPTQLLYKSKGNILPLLFFSFPEQIGCHYVQLSLLRLGRGGGGTRQEEWWKEETVLEKMLTVHQRGKTASSYKEPALHTHWFTRETQRALIFKNKIGSREKRTGRERMQSPWWSSEEASQGWDGGAACQNTFSGCVTYWGCSGGNL